MKFSLHLNKLDNFPTPLKSNNFKTTEITDSSKDIKLTNPKSKEGKIIIKKNIVIKEFSNALKDIITDKKIKTNAMMLNKVLGDRKKYEINKRANEKQTESSLDNIKTVQKVNNTVTDFYKPDKVFDERRKFSCNLKKNKLNDNIQQMKKSHDSSFFKHTITNPFKDKTFEISHDENSKEIDSYNIYSISSTNNNMTSLGKKNNKAEIQTLGSNLSKSKASKSLNKRDLYFKNKSVYKRQNSEQVSVNSSNDNSLNTYSLSDTKQYLDSTPQKSNVFKSILSSNSKQKNINSPNQISFSHEKKKLIPNNTKLQTINSEGNDVSYLLSEHREKEKSNYDNIRVKNTSLRFKDSEKFIKYIIRDHSIGEKSNQVSNSKRKMRLFADLSKLKEKQLEKKLKIKINPSKSNLTCSDDNISDTETQKKDILNSSQDEEILFNLENGHEHKELIENLIHNDNFANKGRKNYSEKSTAGNLTTNQSRNSVILGGKLKKQINDNPRKIVKKRRRSFNSDFTSINTLNFKEDAFDYYQQILRKIQDKRIKQDSKKLVEMIENLTKLSYESIDEMPSIYDKSRLLNKNNFERIYRLRNIARKREDPLSDNHSLENADKTRKFISKDFRHVRSISSLGAPKFLKTKFTKRTLFKFKEVNGKYFGCIV